MPSASASTPFERDFQLLEKLIFDRTITINNSRDRLLLPIALTHPIDGVTRA